MGHEARLVQRGGVSHLKHGGRPVEVGDAGSNGSVGSVVGATDGRGAAAEVHHPIVAGGPWREGADLQVAVQAGDADEEGLLAVLPLLYPGEVVEGVRQELERARTAGDVRWHAEILSRYERRRGDLGLFLKEVKLRITFYMNKRLKRSGTLWEGRYRSVLVEDGEQALLTVAAYIDLNPIRAGLVSRPEDYRWSGYGEAVGGGKRASRAREGLGRMLGEALRDPEFRHDWRRTAARYRTLLYQDGQEVAGDPDLGQDDRRGMSAEVVEAVVGQGGAMPLREALRRRVRYFCDGAVLGGAEFVEAVFEREQALRKRFGEKRTSGARRMRGAEWGDLRVLRDLQKDVMGGSPRFRGLNQSE
jgi:hypothetical protein